VVYVLSSTVIMGIIPNAELQVSHAPFAEAAGKALGPASMIIVALCAILKSVGSLGGWMLLVGQSAKAAADDGMFPRVFGRLNRHGVPGMGLIIVGVLMTAMLFATMSPTIANQFNRLIDLAVILAVVPYVYAAVAMVKVVFDHEGGKGVRKYMWITFAAVLYCIGAVVGGAPKTVVAAFVALLASVPLYPFFFRSMERAAQQKREHAPAVPAES
jgi:arginine:agmatine antiporter